MTATEMLTATVTTAGGSPVAGTDVTFTVTAGPDAPRTAKVATTAVGQAVFALPNSGAPGTDTVVASFSDNTGTHASNPSTVQWTATPMSGRAT
ncbi:MAG: hypothetical protein M3137_11370, partial [Actinomycetota bacterium]|nr:hypothetical protein [Actinomycetota bacterium]